MTYQDPSDVMMDEYLRMGVEDPEDILAGEAMWLPNQREQYRRVFNEKLPSALERKRRQEKVDAEAWKHQNRIPVAKNVRAGLVAAGRDLGSLAARLTGDHESADSLNRSQARTDEGHAKADTFDEVPDVIQSGARGAVRSWATALPMSLTPLGPGGTILGFAASEANRALTEAEDAGMEGPKKWWYVGRAAAIEGAVAGVFQLVGLGGFEKMLSRGVTRASLKGFLKQTGISLLEELPEEGLTEILHAFNNAAAGLGPAVTPENAVQTLWQTTVQTAMTVGLGAVVSARGNIKAEKDRDTIAAGLASRYSWTQEQARGIVDRAADSGEAFWQTLGREVRDEHVVSPTGLVKWMESHPAQAAALAAVETPSRRDFDVAGLPRRPKENRRHVADTLRELLTAQEEASLTAEAEPDAVTEPPQPPPLPTEEPPAAEPPPLPTEEPPAAEPTTEPPATAEPPAPGLPAQEPRQDTEGKKTAQDPDSPPAAPVGQRMAPEVQDPASMVSKTGRRLSPYPDRAITSKSASTRAVREADEWLISEAIAEAEANGDDFVVTMFKPDLKVGKDGLPQATRDMAHDYLFGREDIRLERPPAQGPPADGKKKAGPLTRETASAIATELIMWDIHDAKGDPETAERFGVSVGAVKRIRKHILLMGDGDDWVQRQAEELDKGWADNALGIKKPKVGQKGVKKKKPEPPAPEPKKPEAPAEPPPPAPEPKKPEPPTPPPPPEPPAGPPPPEPKKPEPTGQPSKGFTNLSAEKQARAEELKRRIKERLNRMSAGVDPTLMVDGIELTALYVEDGVRGFAEYARKVLDDFGPKAKGYLLAWWQGTAGQSELGSEMEDITRKQADEIIAGIESGKEDKAQDPADTIETRARAIIESDDDAGAKNRAMKKLADDFGLSEKEAQERVEAVLVDMAREIASNTWHTGDHTFTELVKLYERQPRFSKRTSTSMDLQAYSTPIPLAFAASAMAGVNRDTTLYEPTAGMGALTITADPAKTTVNEIDTVRRGELAKRGYGEVTGNDAVTYVPGTKVDRVQTNPPFGPAEQQVNIEGFVLKKKDHIIAAKALEAMKDDGVASIIIGGSLEKGKLSGQDRVFINYLMSRFNVVGNYEVDGGLYSAQGAKFPVRLIVVAGRHDSTGVQDLAPDSVERLESWDEVWDKVQEVRDARQRVRDDLGTPGDPKSPDGDPEGKGGSGGSGRSSRSPRGHGGKNGGRGGRRPGPRKQPSGGQSEHEGSDTDPKLGKEGDGKASDPSGSPDDDPITVDGDGKEGSGDGADDREGAGSDSRDGKDEPRDVDGGDALLVPEGPIANDRQRHYRSASRAPGLKTLVSRMMSRGTARALSDLVKKHGDIDAWVAGKLGYDSVEEMHQGLGAEQVDGVALAIDKIESGGAIIIGDETGIGKGRQAAALIRYAQHMGYLPVFVTAKAKLFSDMYGDMLDIGGSVSPLLLGDPKEVAIKNKNGKTLVKPLTGDGQDKAMQDDVDGSSLRDAGYDSVFLTYSQLKDLENLPGGGFAPNSRHRFLSNLAKRDNVLVILDESHKGAGRESVTGLYLRGGTVKRKVDGAKVEIPFDGFLRGSGVRGVTYLSATYAKTPDAMPLYFRTSLSRCGVGMGSLVEMFKRGGDALQQWAANALASTGDMIRREQDFDGVTFAVQNASFDEEHTTQIIETTDRVSEVLREILEFSRSAAEAIKDSGSASTADTDKQLRVGEFTSVIHNYLQQILLALKVDATVAQALASHEKGEASVIAVSNTMESFLSEYARENGLKVGEDVRLTFGDVLKRALGRTMRASRTDAGGQKEKFTFTAAQLGLEDEYNAIIDMIDDMGDAGRDLPVSPLDAIRAQLTKAGIRVGEITGREKVLDYHDDGSARLSERVIDNNGTVNSFQAGELDVLLLNKSGAEGISLHASKRNPPAGQRPRHMIVAQADLDINVFKQILGRILRTGLAGPAPKMARYTVLSSPIAAERRPMAILLRKLASLNANTTADTSGDVKLGADALDFFNKLGDQIVSEILAEDNELSATLGIVVINDEEKGVKAEKQVARTATGRMAVLPNADQDAIYSLIEERYKALVDEMKESGTYDLEMDVQEKWAARPVSQEVIDRGDDNSSPFTSDVVLGQWSIVDPRKPMTPKELKAALVRRWGTDDPGQVRASFLAEAAEAKSALDKAAAEYIGEEPEDPGPDADEADKKAYARIVKTRGERVRRVESASKNLDDVIKQVARMAGTDGSITVGILNDDKKSKNAAPTALEYRGTLLDLKLNVPKAGNPYRLGNIRFVFAVEAQRRTVTLTAAKLNTDDVMLYDDNEQGKANYDSFGTRLALSERVEKTILTGNIMKAMTVTAVTGQLTTFATEDGKQVTGIVMPDDWTMASAASDPRTAIKDGESAVRLLTQHGGWWLPSAMRARIIGEEKAAVPVITKTRDSGIRITVPKSRTTGGHIFLDNGLRAIVGDFHNRGSMMIAEDLDAATAARAIDYILKTLEVGLRADNVSAADVARAHGVDPEAPTGASRDHLSNAPSRGQQGRPGRKIGAIRQDGAAVNPDAPVKASDVSGAIRKLWPDVTVRGAVTFRKKNPGWYDRMLGLIRLRDTGDVATLLHELGHHFDREMSVWMRTNKMPMGAVKELLTLGKKLYGSTRPQGGYRAEGFAEFIRGYVVGEDMAETAPKMNEWFTRYLAGNPAEASKLRKLEDIVARFQLQTPEMAVRAFTSPIKRDWSPRRIAAAIAAQHVDVNLPVLEAMEESGADLKAILPENHPYMLLTHYSRSAGGRAQYAVLSATTDLAGNVTGIGLRQALAPVSKMGGDAVKRFFHYAVARRALVLHARGINPGLSKADAEGVVKKHQSDDFDKVLKAVTDWNHRVTHLLVEAGHLSKEDFAKIVAANPVYVPFSRQFADDELNDNRKGGVGSLHRIKGSGREINDPLDAMIAQAEKTIETALRADVMHAMARFYETQRGKAGALGSMMAEIPAPMMAATVSAEQAKGVIEDRAVRMGVPRDFVQKFLAEDDWSDMLTVFTQAPEFRGKENVVAITVKGVRRFFEVQKPLVAALGGISSEGVLPGKLGEFSRAAVALQRLGATGLNPAFSLLRNPLRDMLTAAVTGDYHFHLPMLSTLRGMLLDVAQTEDALRYHAAGLDIGGRIGQDLRGNDLLRTISDSPAGKAVGLNLGKTQASRMAARATAATPIKKLRALGSLSGLREILSHSEVGPRLMEFQAAYTAGMKQYGSAKSAMVLAGCASKDVTVNFSRAGSTGRKINEVVLFYNAGIQSISKFGRTFGFSRAMPWESNQDRGKALLKTAAKGAAAVTVAALANYFRNRDEDWWDELPSYEKWTASLVDCGDGRIVKIPLPFEFGFVFGALPVAMLEERRRPGALREALAVGLDNLSPLGFGSIHALARNFAAISPMADVLANKTWNDTTIVPEHLESTRLPKDQYGPQTTDLAKWLGAIIGYSPARVDHILNGYTGGLYKRLAGTVETMVDPSAVGSDGDMSTLPLLGGMFRRPTSSRVIGDYYERLEDLRQLKGSGEASLAEVGELAAAERLNRDLGESWRAHRDVISSDRKSVDIKRDSDALVTDIQAKIKGHQSATVEGHRKAGIATLAYQLTDPATPENKRRSAADALVAEGVTVDEAVAALRDEAKFRGMNRTMRGSSGRLTAYGLRIERLRRAFREAAETE